MFLPSQGAADSDIRDVDVGSLEMSRPRTVGVEHIGLWAMEQVGFEKILQDSGLNGVQRAAVIGSVIGRMACPGPGLSTHDERTWLPLPGGKP